MRKIKDKLLKIKNGLSLKRMPSSSKEWSSVINDKSKCFQFKASKTNQILERVCWKRRDLSSRKSMIMSILILTQRFLSIRLILTRWFVHCVISSFIRSIRLNADIYFVRLVWMNTLFILTRVQHVTRRLFERRKFRNVGSLTMPLKSWFIRLGLRAF